MVVLNKFLQGQVLSLNVHINYMKKKISLPFA